MPVISRINRQWNANFVKSVAFFVLAYAVAGVTTSAAFYPQKALAYVKSNEQVADIARSITVRIEGAATPASGVLVHREGNRYTVLTAWHVVSAQNPGEELAIYTSDGIQHQLDRGSIERVGNVDLAVLTFTTRNRYQIAILNTAQPKTGSRIYLYGYPAATTTVPMRISRGSSGEIVGSTTNQQLNGYELMYATQMPSMTGMSGGPVLDSEGNLIGIHARSETDQTQTIEEGVAIRTGMSQGVPISYFSRSIAAVEAVEKSLAQFSDRANERESPRLTTLPRLDTNEPAVAAVPLGINSKIDKIWVKARQAITLKQLARQIEQDEALLSLLNDVKTDHVFGRSEWIVLPSGSIKQVKLMSAVDTSELRRTPPLEAPPEPSDTGRIQRGDNTLAKVAERYNLSIQKLLKLNPGLRGAQLVVGTPIRVAQANAGRSRVVLGLKPVGSGGLSWPDQPDFGAGENLNDRSWIWPTKGIYSSGYGWRSGQMHYGIDISNTVGTPIVASRTGRVIFAGWDQGGLGYLVSLRHADGSVSRYGHNSKILVDIGDEVIRGKVIALMGNSGAASTSMLHFEISPSGAAAVNPLQYLPPRGD